MNRAVALVLAAGLLLTGCSDSSSPEAPPPPVVSVEPTATLQALHRDDFISVRAAANPEVASMQVGLRGGEPTGSAPFVALGLLQSRYPGRESYQVTYAMPAGRPGKITPPARFGAAGPYDRVAYLWDPATRVVEWSVIWTSGSLATGAPLGHVSDVDTATIEAVANKKLASPVFEE